MLSLRTLALSSLCALTSPACDAPAPAQQTPPADPPRPASPPAPATDAAAAQAHYVRALEHESAGRIDEARAEIARSLAAGDDHDARLLAAKLAILRNDLDAASTLLAPLAADATDALVHYNLGLIAQQRGQYNDARAAYLAALRADPAYAPARFNLAVLAWDAGVREEAQHHARKFLELAPDDPRAGELRARLELAANTSTNRPAGAPTPSGQAPTDPQSGLRDPFANSPKPASDLEDPLAPSPKPTRSDNGLKDPFARK